MAKVRKLTLPGCRLTAGPLPNMTSIARTASTYTFSSGSTLRLFDLRAFLFESEAEAGKLAVVVDVVLLRRVLLLPPLADPEDADARRFVDDESVVVVVVVEEEDTPLDDAAPAAARLSSGYSDNFSGGLRLRIERRGIQLEVEVLFGTKRGFSLSSTREVDIPCVF